MINNNPVMRSAATATPRHALALAAALAVAPTGWASDMATGHAGHDAHAHHHHQMQMARASTATRHLASYSIPEVTLVDQQGTRVALPQLLDSDQPLLLNFIFTSCTTICPVMSASFARIQSGLGDDATKVRMVSVSIDPEYDTPARLAEYAERFHAGPQWVFLTGTLEDSVAVQQAFASYRGDKMNHAPLTLMRARPDAQWVRYDGFADSAALVKEARAMIAD